MAKLTEEELRKIIQEELEDIDENIFDRFLARARGSLEKGKAGVSNIGKGISQTFKGEKPSGRVNVEKYYLIDQTEPLSLAKKYLKMYPNLLNKIEILNLRKRGIIDLKKNNLSINEKYFNIHDLIVRKIINNY